MIRPRVTLWVMPRRSSKDEPKADKPKRPGTARDHDFATVARSVVERAIGERLDGSPLPPAPAKNPAAVALGKLGGQKGGRARAEALTPAKRRSIARKAAAARWKKD
jgi:hypothetical protein